MNLILLILAVLALLILRNYQVHNFMMQLIDAVYDFEINADTFDEDMERSSKILDKYTYMQLFFKRLDPEKLYTEDELNFILYA